MIHPSSNLDVEAVYQLLTSYSFDAETYQTKAVIAEWLTEFDPNWVSHAITEALYQGRYKVISVDQILKLWQRRGQPIRHFNREFESIILGQALLYPTGYGDGPETFSSRRAASLVSARTPGGGGLDPEMAAPAVEPSPVNLDQINCAEPADYAARDTAGTPSGAPIGTPGDLETENRPAATSASASEGAPASDEASQDQPGATIRSKSTADSADETYAAVPNFRPIGSSGLSPQQEAIQPFVPRHDEPEFHQRLRAVVQGGMGT